MFESYMAERLRRRWVRLRLYRFPGSVLTDYRILKNYAKTLKRLPHEYPIFTVCPRATHCGYR